MSKLPFAIAQNNIRHPGMKSKICKTSALKTTKHCQKKLQKT